MPQDRRRSGNRRKVPEHTKPQKYLFGHLPRLRPFSFGRMSPRAKEFIQWVKTSRPEVIIAFNNVHHAIFRSEFHSETPYICLHAEEGEEESGVLEAMPSVARQAVNLLHFCRRTHQWGIPKERIDHVVEPIWFEGKTLPEKSEEWAP